LKLHYTLTYQCVWLAVTNNCIYVCFTDLEQYNEAVTLMETISSQLISWRTGNHILGEGCLWLC